MTRRGERRSTWQGAGMHLNNKKLDRSSFRLQLPRRSLLSSSSISSPGRCARRHCFEAATDGSPEARLTHEEVHGLICQRPCLHMPQLLSCLSGRLGCCSFSHVVFHIRAMVDMGPTASFGESEDR